MTSTPDPRVYAADPQARVAETALRGQLAGGGWHFVTPRAVWAGARRVALRAAPDPQAPRVTEALPGEALDALWDGGPGWVRVRTTHDGYLGWARRADLTDVPAAAPVTVTALRAHAFAAPHVSAPVQATLCFGARLGAREAAPVTESGRVWRPVTLPGGSEAWVPAAALAAVPDPDPAAFALRLAEAPYVWGGRSAWGLDCSGLTQLAFAAFGRALPRDADQQQAALTPVAAPQRGDLAFFPGHVGVMLGPRRMVHANATHMRVTVETLGAGTYGAQLQATCTGFGRWSA